MFFFYILKPETLEKQSRADVAVPSLVFNKRNVLLTVRRRRDTEREREKPFGLVLRKNALDVIGKFEMAVRRLLLFPYYYFSLLPAYVGGRIPRP